MTLDNDSRLARRLPRSTFSQMSVPPIVVSESPLAYGSFIEPRRAVVAKADRLYADCLEKAVQLAFPSIEVQRATNLKSARAKLDMGDVDILLTGVGFDDGDALEWIAELANTDRVSRIVVITARREVRLHLAFREMRLHGLFNAFDEGLSVLVPALHKIWEGNNYRSPSFKNLLQMTKDEDLTLLRQLSPKEQLVLSVIGDGSDDQEAANRLSMTAAAVRTHRKRLHAKLGISHKGELMRLAIRHGFVWVTAEKIVRPGFSQLMARVTRSPFNR
jgi:DNA-binding NarL/FixJ family response regulator